MAQTILGGGTDYQSMYGKWTSESATPSVEVYQKSGSRKLRRDGSNTSLCVSGSQVYHMPKDHVDRIMDQVHQRQIAVTARAPVAIPKKILRKYSVYLPKPPPPKLSVRGYPKHRWSDRWTVKKEAQENRSRDETPRSVPETERDWFPNVEYKEQYLDEEDDEQKQQEQWDSLWDVEEGEEWEEWEQEQEHEAEEIPAQQSVKEERDETGQGQQEVEEEWPQEKDEEMHESPYGDEQELEEEWLEEEANNDWAGKQYPPEQDDGSNQGEAPIPIPAPKLRPISSKPKLTGPMFVPLNKGKGKQSKGMDEPSTAYPTPLTHPIVAPYVQGGGKGAKGKKATWTHPIQDPYHPVHKGYGRIVQPEMPNQWTTIQKGEWTPPPFPGQYQMAPFPYHMGYGQQMSYMDQGPGRMLPPWMQPGDRQPTVWDPDSGYESSEDTDGEESSKRNKTDKKVRKKPKNPNPKRRKYKIWITINGKRQQASYWK